MYFLNKLVNVIVTQATLLYVSNSLVNVFNLIEIHAQMNVLM